MWQIISDFVGNIILMSGALVYSTTIFGKEAVKVSKWNLLKVIVYISILHTLVLMLLTGTLKTIIMTILNMLFFMTILKKGKKESFLITFLYMILLILPDLVQLFFMTNILQLSKEFCYSFAGSILSNVIITILLIAITFLLKKHLRKILNTKIENNTEIIICSIMIFICVGMFFHTVIKEFRFNDNIVLYLLFIIVLVVVLFSLIKQTIENKKITNEYDKLLEFMMTYENEIENQRILRHEIKNEFRTIRAKICDKQKNKEIIEYIDEIVNEKYEINKEKYAKFGYLPPNGIKGLFYFKTQEAENKGIKVSISISKRLKNSTIYKLNIKQQRDFGRIIGVFLDNAIEASVETKEKQIGIEVYVNDEDEVKLIISNTYNNQIDRTKLGIESFSTKGNARGHGLLLVKQLVNKNNVFDIKTEIQNNIYIQTLEIKKIIED